MMIASPSLQSATAALAIAQQDFPAGTLRIWDVRVDAEFRRQGLGSALVFSLIESARALECRAVSAVAPANNFPANAFLAKLGFELSGLDEKRLTNHDLVKEAVTLFWYLPLG